jgi:hypothetical protein
MAKQLLRPRVARLRVAVGKTNFEDNFVYHGGAGQEFVPHTGDTVRRLRPVRIGVRGIAFLEDEVDALIEALARRRDTHPETLLPRPLAGRAAAAPTSPPARPRRRGTDTEAPVVKRRRLQAERAVELLAGLEQSARRGR